VSVWRPGEADAATPEQTVELSEAPGVVLAAYWPSPAEAVSGPSIWGWSPPTETP
jgi:hypothetical protein